MKKLVLIPQERYEQLLSRESQKEGQTKVHSDSNEPILPRGKEEEEEEKADIKKLLPESDGGKSERFQEEKQQGSLLRDQSAKTPLPPPPPLPPGEPALMEQIGAGIKKSKQKNNNKKDLWRAKWTNY